jgi:hypothetical protein
VQFHGPDLVELSFLRNGHFSEPVLEAAEAERRRRFLVAGLHFVAMMCSWEEDRAWTLKRMTETCDVDVSEMDPERHAILARTGSDTSEPVVVAGHRRDARTFW